MGSIPIALPTQTHIVAHFSQTQMDDCPDSEPQWQSDLGTANDSQLELPKRVKNHSSENRSLFPSNHSINRLGNLPQHQYNADNCGINHTTFLPKQPQHRFCNKINHSWKAAGLWCSLSSKYTSSLCVGKPNSPHILPPAKWIRS